jgi:hypothetical protein
MIASKTASRSHFCTLKPELKLHMRAPKRSANEKLTELLEITFRTGVLAYAAIFD